MDYKKALKAYGHTTTSMAKLLGTSQQALSEKFVRRTVTFAKLEEIAGFCNTTILDFIEAGMEKKKSLFCAFVYEDGINYTFNDKTALRNFLSDEKQ